MLPLAKMNVEAGDIAKIGVQIAQHNDIRGWKYDLPHGLTRFYLGPDMIQITSQLARNS